jgi:hypothetical protein
MKTCSSSAGSGSNGMDVQLLRAVVCPTLRQGRLSVYEFNVQR